MESLPEEKTSKKRYIVAGLVITISIIAVWQIFSILNNTVFYQTPHQTLTQEVQGIQSKYQLDCDHIMTGVQICGQLQPILNDIDKRLTVLESHKWLPQQTIPFVHDVKR